MNRWLGSLGTWLAYYLNAPRPVHNTGPATPPEHVLACLQPADVLLVEGKQPCQHGHQVPDSIHLVAR